MKLQLPSPLLVIEASSSAGSIALLVDGVLAAEEAVVMGPSREDVLLPAMASVLERGGVHPSDVQAVACGSGPGSFTSLRIAAALAKGIVVANQASLYAVPSLWLAAAALRNGIATYLVHANALRGERYVLRVHFDGTDAMHVSEIGRMALDDVLTAAANERAALVAVGDTTTGDHDLRAVQPHARNVVLLDAVLWRTCGPVSVAEWEPAYGRLAEAQVKWETTHGRGLPGG